MPKAKKNGSVKRSPTNGKFVVGRAAFKKVSEVEGLHMSKSLAGEFQKFDKDERLPRALAVRRLRRNTRNSPPERTMYEVEDDFYCYPGTNVLKNIPGIRDQEILTEFELAMSTQRADEPLPGAVLAFGITAPSIIISSKTCTPGRASFAV